MGHRAINLLKLGFPVWAAIELVQGQFGNALALLAMFAVLQVPRLLQLPWVFDGAYLAAWTLQALGQVAGFWARVPWWDTLVHAALPAVLAPTGLVLLIRLRVLPNVLNDERVRRPIATVLLVFMIAAGFGCLYEIYEWFADSSFGTHYQPDNADTMTDITANVVGGILGGIWLAAWSVWSRRAAPQQEGPSLRDRAR